MTGILGAEMFLGPGPSAHAIDTALAHTADHEGVISCVADITDG